MESAIEKWINIKDTVYQISNLGNIKNKNTNRLLKQNIGTHGYPQIRLYIDGIGKTLTIHSIVAFYFLGVSSDNKHVNHKDGNKTNNKLSNLEYVSRSENQKHACLLGLQKQTLKSVIQYSLNGDIVSEFESIKQASIITNTNMKSISNVCNNRAKTANNFIWKHKKNNYERISN